MKKGDRVVYLSYGQETGTKLYNLERKRVSELIPSSFKTLDSRKSTLLFVDDETGEIQQKRITYTDKIELL